MKSVLSSHGSFSIDDDGNVLEWNPFDECDPDTRRAYGAIRRFDLAEYRAAYPDEREATSFDILDLGNWTEAGAYESADPGFRAMVAENRNASGPAGIMLR